MKKLTLFLLVLICLFGNITHSQEINYDLSNYKVPHLKRQTLSTNFNFNSNRGARISEFSDTLSNLKDENYYLDLNGNINLGYTGFFNSDKYQGQHKAYIDYSPEYDVKKDSMGTTHETLTKDLNVSINSENRYYFYNKLFSAINPSININTENEHTPIDPDFNDKKYKYYNSYIKIPVEIGYGRIEQVQDARLAVYIFDDLLKNNMLTRQPTELEIEEFAELISTVLNERVLDSRKKRIYEVNKINQFLQEKGLIETSNEAYLALVYDNWEFAHQPIREHGYQLSAGYSKTFSNYENDHEILYKELSTPSKYNNHQKSNSNNLTFRASYTKPLNLKWQGKVLVKSFIGKNDYKTEITESGIYMDTTYTTEYDRKLASLSIYGMLGYYPNSRTSLNLYSTYSYQHTKTFYEDYDEDANFHQINFRFKALYYVSDRLSLFANINHSVYNKSSKNKVNTIDYENISLHNYQSFAVGLTYAFY